MNIKITDVRALKGDSAFLIDSGKTSILYDSGFAFTGYRIAENIRRELKDRPLDYIFLTHSHYDHALGSVYIKRHYPNAKVIAGEYAARIFAKDSAKAVMRDLDRKFAKANGISEYEDLIDELKVDITVKDGDNIQAGDMCFTAVNLPGHTRCSVGYYLEREKLLLSSETLGVFDGEGTVVPSYLVGIQMTLDSIDKATALDIEKILLPHYGLLDNVQTKLYLANAKKSAVETFEEISGMLKAGKTKAECIEFFKNKFYSGYIKTIYPIDAMLLNTGITVDLIARETGVEL